MHAEISKRALSEETERKHYDSVNMQMGRVQLDSEWNEAFEMLLKSRSGYLKDIIGEHGSPNDGFRVKDNLVLDHLDSLKDWTFSGAGSCRVDYLEKLEGLGSFRITGNGEVERQTPALLSNLKILRDILEDRGATVVSAPKLLLYYKVSATEDARIRIEISKAAGLDPVATDPTPTYPCDDWQVLELDLGGIELDEYESIAIHVETTGTVHLDCLATAPGLEADNSDSDFHIQGGDGTTENAGRYYVEGMIAVKEGFETYRTQADYPEPPGIDLDEGLDYLAYLDVWKRTVTHVEDPDILEVALDGPDTCSREQVIAQVKVMTAPDCEADIPEILRPDGTGTLSTGLSAEAEQAECDFRPEMDYTGLSNSLYRIEIQDGGDSGAAIFKWSRNNGADLEAITGFDADTKSVIVASDRFLCHEDWVELCDDVSDLADFKDSNKHSRLARIADITHLADGVKIQLENEVGDFTTVPFMNRTGKYPKLRKWHGVEKVSDYLTFDVNNKPEKELEHGIRIGFDGGPFYHGDYWQFTARINTRSIDELDHEKPMGPVHHYAPLGTVTSEEEDILFNSCRNVFPPLTDITAGNVSFDSSCCDGMEDLGVENVQQALEYLCKSKCCDIVVFPGQSIQDAVNSLGIEGGTIYLAPGIHIVHETILVDEKKDILIKGDAAATRVIYLPMMPDIDEELIQGLREKIKLKEEEINAAMEAGNDSLASELRAERRVLQIDLYRAMGLTEREIEVRNELNEVQDKMEEAGENPEELEKLWELYEELNIKLEGVLHDQLLDLFRVTDSRNIFFERFLMLSFGADSLVAILDESHNTMIRECDLINIPERKYNNYNNTITENFAKNEYVRSNITKTLNAGKKKLMFPCIRTVNACKLEIKQNRTAGLSGLIQEGGYDAAEMPLLHELLCTGNFFRTFQAGIILIKCDNSLIEDNIILAQGRSKEEMDLLKDLIEEDIDINDPCKVRLNDQANELIDTLRDMLFRCTPDMEDVTPLKMEDVTPLKNGGIFAYILRKSSIINNRIVANTGIHLFYSKDNKILENNICVSEKALLLIYNFRTRVCNNDFKTIKATRPDETDKILDSYDMPDIETDRPGSFTGSSKSAVFEVHFSDRLKFSDNRVKGSNGCLSRSYGVKDHLFILQAYAEIWNTSFKEEATVLLVDEFIDLMGLTPSFNLLETLLSIFTGGRDVDWVALMVESWTGRPIGNRNDALRESIGFMGVSSSFKENPFITLLFKLFNYILNMQVVSRTSISRNRFDVEGFGIGMLAGITLGGVKISENRITGQTEGGIIWRAFPVLNNPEFTGQLLGCIYSILITVLTWIRDFLVKLIDILDGEEDENEGEEGASAIAVLILVFTLYGFGQLCPNEEVEAAGENGDAESEPENPFLVYMIELLAAIDDLIEQLEDEDVKRTIDDLSGSNDQICNNKIQGMGTGIRTNVANIRIESNHIDLAPGKSAIEELFAMGRFLTAHAKVINCLDENNAGGEEKINHTAVVSLGNAIMNMNPDSLEAARGMLEENPGQWAELETVLEKIRDIGVKSPLAAGISTGAENLRTAVVNGDMPAVLTSSNTLINEIKKHMTGYGMILEAPGMQVVKNHIESQTTCKNKDVYHRGPGGILMTCGGNMQDMVAYFLLLEETFPLVNIGGQRTLFSGNSIQWGTGHGIMLSSLPIITDVRIEDNEIQNQGMSGVYCDTPLLTTFFTSRFNKKLFAESNIGIGIVLPFLFELISNLFMVYKLRVTGNEINQCFRNKAEGFYSETPPASPPKDIVDSIRIWGLFPTVLGGVMVKNASEAICAQNSIRYCGKGDETWNCFGSVFYQSNNTKYENNKILGNGRADSHNSLYYPRGGALFNGMLGSLTVSSNDFVQNDGNTLVVVPKFSLIAKMNIYNDDGEIDTYLLPGHVDIFSMDNLLILGNEFNIQDNMASTWWSKIHAGYADETDPVIVSYDSIKNLTFSQNQVILPQSKPEDLLGGIYLAGERLTFNGNIVSGGLSVETRLFSDKGLGIGNMLHTEPLTSGDVIITPDNNRW